ncbi:MAG TPA: hypothetical protein PK733_13820 [Clostridiales bacterium]|nr:hypothetical protein [Clostridiales bacterium]
MPLGLKRNIVELIDHDTEWEKLVIIDIAVAVDDFKKFKPLIWNWEVMVSHIAAGF